MDEDSLAYWMCCEDDDTATCGGDHQPPLSQTHIGDKHMRNLIADLGNDYWQVKASYVTDELLATWIEDARQQCLKAERAEFRDLIAITDRYYAADHFRLCVFDDAGTLQVDIDEAYCLTIADILRESDFCEIRKITCTGEILLQDKTGELPDCGTRHWLIEITLEHDLEMA